MRSGGGSLNRRIFLIGALVATITTATFVGLATVYPKKNLKISDEWYQATGSLILAEQWSWDWTHYETSGPWVGGPPYLLYKMVGDTLFLTWPSGTLMTAYRIGETSTWVWRGVGTGVGGPGGNMMLMNNMTIALTFTYEDIPETSGDDDYKDLRIVVDMRQDLYHLVNTGGNLYVWQGLVHQHFLSWAPEGTKA